MFHQQTVTAMSGCWMWKRRWRETLVFLGPRLVVQVFLLAAFLHFFGFPAVSRFEKKSVMIVESAKDTDGIPFPALTIAAVGQITADTCFRKNTAIEDCIEKNTLKWSDIIKSSVLGYYGRRKEINLTQEFVSEDFTFVLAGKYYTLNLPIMISPNSLEHQFFLGLNSNLTCSVFVHDPKYFMFNFNPIALPSTMRKFTTTVKKSWYYTMQLTEVTKLNLPSSPCNDDPSYNFQSCLRRSISAKVLKKTFL